MTTQIVSRSISLRVRPSDARYQEVQQNLRRSSPEKLEVSDSPQSEIRLTTDLPPSVNKLYVRRRGGGIALTKTALEYREKMRKAVVRVMHEVLRFPVSDETVYELSVVLFFETLENPGWSRTNKQGQRQAMTRYKVVDIDNRVKFLQDCLVKALGIPNDCQIFRGSQEKHEDPKNPRVEITIRPVSVSQFFSGEKGAQ